MVTILFNQEIMVVRVIIDNNIRMQTVFIILITTLIHNRIGLVTTITTIAEQIHSVRVNMMVHLAIIQIHLGRDVIINRLVDNIANQFQSIIQIIHRVRVTNTVIDLFDKQQLVIYLNIFRWRRYYYHYSTRS